MADPSPAQRHRRPQFVMTAYCDGAGVWLFRLKSLKDGSERVIRDVQELLTVLEALADQVGSGRKETHAQA